MADKLMSPTELAAYLNVPLATVYRWNHIGSGPPVLHVGRHVRYRPSAVETWLAAQMPDVVRVG
jgi:excisionase family DNA binding protein